MGGILLAESEDVMLQSHHAVNATKFFVYLVFNYHHIISYLWYYDNLVDKTNWNIVPFVVFHNEITKIRLIIFVVISDW